MWILTTAEELADASTFNWDYKEAAGGSLWEGLDMYR